MILYCWPGSPAFFTFHKKHVALQVQSGLPSAFFGKGQFLQILFTEKCVKVRIDKLFGRALLHNLFQKKNTRGWGLV